MDSPKLILLFSGKRKSGKDFVTSIIQQRLGSSVCAILRLSGPLKEQYAKEHGLDFRRLLDASGYKEKFREDMIRWGEEKRNADPGYFCRLIVRDVPQLVWIVSDARRGSDVEWFRYRYQLQTRTVRVQASEESRRERGWVYTAASCEHKGQVFGIGETWLTKECYQCICLNPFGVGCCDDGQQPVDYPDWCEVIRKPDSCSVAVVMRANHKIPCIANTARSRLRGSERTVWKEPNDPLY